MTIARIAPWATLALLCLAQAAAAQSPSPWPSNAPAAGTGQFPPAKAPAAGPGQFPPANAPTALPAQPGAVPPPSQWGNPGAAAASHPAWGGGGAPLQRPGAPSGGPPCADEFMPLRNEAQTKGMAIKAAVDRKAERSEICKVFRTFVAAEAKVVKFVQSNGSRCSIPDDAVKVMKANHSKSVTMSNRVCNAAAGPGPAPAPPSLSDALGTSRIPDSSTIKTGKGGTFDTLSGSPLARMIPAGGRVADAAGNWVDTLAPHWTRPYLRLARLDRPIGSWLLLMPCWWSAGLAAIAFGARFPDPWHVALFFVGAFAMRGAGCTWNDLVDRDLDAKVERTRSRPIPSGQVTPKQALAFLVLQALVGLIVLLQFNSFTIATGIASLGTVAIYPFLKRVTHWPQIGLGLAFSWGALMGWPAVFGQLDMPAFILYAGSICWVIAYDTVYAHQDRDDDALIGIKSTAILFGEKTGSMLTGFFAAAAVLIGIAGYLANAGWLFAFGLLAFAAHLAWQVRSLDISDPALCLRLFKSNRDAGLILFAGMILDAAF